MVEEHGYQRSGKKCKEKFENLYKYYKKTKEGKAGRQGGKHYRFFRQLEAIYGEASNNHASVSELHLARNSFPYHHHHQIPNNMINQENQEVVQNPSLSFTNSSEFETSSSENNDDDLSAIAFMMNQGKHQKGKDEKKSWKTKVEEFVDSQMRKIIDTQEAWMERMLRSFESREQERVCKEEEWRKQEAARFDQEVHELWAKERAWVEARDIALMGALKKFVGKGHEPILTDENDTKFLYGTIDHNVNRWTEPEISSLIHLRNSLELRFQEGEYLEEGLWEEIAAKMASLGHDRSAIDYKEKWENISIYYNKAVLECNKKEKEDLDLRSSGFCQHLNSYICQGIPKQRPEISSMGLQLTVEGLPPSSSINVGENVWEKYGVSKLNKGKNQQV
jgi:hypothetical protein